MNLFPTELQSTFLEDLTFCTLYVSQLSSSALKYYVTGGGSEVYAFIADVFCNKVNLVMAADVVACRMHTHINKTQDPNMKAACQRSLHTGRHKTTPKTDLFHQCTEFCHTYFDTPGYSFLMIHTA